MEIRLDGKTAIVTGASSGLGAGIARELSRAGAAVVLVGRDEDRLRQIQASIGGGAAHIVSADLTATGASAAVVASALEISGRIDVLIHSAGIYERGPLASADVESLDRQWAINVRAPYELSRAALPHLEPGASIIFITSTAGSVGLPNRVAYCATKGAAEMLMRSTAAELAPQGIRVNSVAPGFIATPMNEKLRADDVLVGYTEALTPVGRIGTVEDVTPAVLFLASEQSAYVQGETLGVNGGYPSPPTMAGWLDKRAGVN